MSVTPDIFSPQVSRVAAGLEGKTIMIYGQNNLGKSFVASKLSKPFFILCESGLNAISGVAYNRVTDWASFRKLVRQLTGKTADQARELYDTIVIDEVYASSVFCQDFIINTYGEGALTLGDGTGKRNLYQLYEKEYFRTINQLLSCDYTVVFIAHEEEQRDGTIGPKGDKRCIKPIIDNCDFVIYLTSNGVDEHGEVILSTGHLAQTDKYFARSRFNHCATEINPFTAENLEKTIREAVEAEVAASGVAAVSYEEQKEMNTTDKMSYEELMDKIQDCGKAIMNAGQPEVVTDIVESVLGAGKKVSACTKHQMDAMQIIYEELCDKAAELGIAYDSKG